MSVLVKGWDMPEACLDSKKHGNLCYLVLKCFNPSKGKPPVIDGRPDWCPLVEVPTPHGNLIDVSNIRKAFSADEDNFTGMGMTVEEIDSYNEGIDEMYRIIQAAPAVIEAEE